MASRWKHDINQNCIFCVSNISQGNVDIQKSASKHTQPFSQKILSSVLFYYDKNHGVFRRQDKHEEEDCSTASLHATGT